jgi:hypothetical protein
MSNYVDKQAKYIQQLTLRHQAYFDICRQELRAEISVLRDLIHQEKPHLLISAN